MAQRLTCFQDGRAGIILVDQVIALYLHADEIFFVSGQWMLSQGLHILLECGNVTPLLFNFLREIFEQLVL